MSEWKMVGKPALILIHMQHGICHEAGTVAFLGHAKATKESGSGADSFEAVAQSDIMGNQSYQSEQWNIIER